MCTWPTEKKRRFLREATETDGGEEIDGESGVSRVVAREQAFEERLQSPGEKIALFTCLTCVFRRKTCKGTNPSWETHMSLSLSLSFGSPM